MSLDPDRDDEDSGEWERCDGVGPLRCVRRPRDDEEEETMTDYERREIELTLAVWDATPHHKPGEPYDRGALFQELGAAYATIDAIRRLLARKVAA